MNNLTDQQLLRDYTKVRSEAAFAELVRRYIDLVYSAALRIVRNPHLAEDVAQAVFAATAQNAHLLVDCPVLPGWLHRTTQNLAANAVRSDVRRRAREQEAVVMNELLSTHSDASWEQIALHLDEALGELNEPDRDVVLLRYFKNHDLRTVGAALGISDDAAQKRVSRAVERLRELFAKRGVTVGAGGLAVVISANAVQAAPVGLALTISTAAALTGTTLASTAAVATVKTIAMTTIQKTAVAATLAVLAGAGIYEVVQASHLRDQVQTLQQQQAPLTAQLQALQREQAELKARLAAVTEENEQWKSGQKLAELLKLRSDLGLLRAENERLAQLFEAEIVQSEKDPIEMRAKRWLRKVKVLREKLAEMPEKSIPELKLLNDRTWLDIARDAGTGTENGLNEAFARLRKEAKEEFAKRLSRALREYAKANGNQLPPDTMALKPYFASPVEDAMLERYELLRSGQLKSDEQMITERAAVDEKYDVLFKIGATGLWFQDVTPDSHLFGSGMQTWTVNDLPLNVQAQQEVQSRQEQEDEQHSLLQEAESEAEDRDERILNRALQEFKAANGGQEPENPSEMMPYLRTSTERAAYERLKQRNGF